MNKISKYIHVSNLGKYFRLSLNPPLFEKGSNEFLFDSNKKRYLDLACGSGTTLLGHNNKFIKQNLKETINNGLIHLGPHFLNTSHIKYFKEISNFLDNRFKFFNLATNGSEATETAIKLAFHHTKRKKIIYFDGSYHGRTGYSLLSSDMKGINKNYFKNNNFIKCNFNDLSDFKDKFQKHKKHIAGVIIEPIQATSGFNFVNKNFLKNIKSIVKKNKSLLIFDEVWTGFGKTGFNFAFEYFKIRPDVLILGKSLGGGLPLGLVAFKDNIKHNYPGAQSSTFQGNLFSISCSNSFLKFIKKSNYLKKIKEIEKFFIQKSKLIESYKFVNRFKGIGCMWGIDIDNSYFPAKDYTNIIRARLLDKGLITWECGKDANVIGLIPPICISKSSLNKSLNIILDTFNDIK